MTLAELAVATGFYKSTILRICESLEKYALVYRMDDGRFKLANGLVRLGEVAKRGHDLRRQIYSVLDTLVSETGESASFYVPHMGKRLCLCRIDSTKSVRDHIKEGDLLPVNVGAAGRVLQRFSKRESASQIPNRDLVEVSLGERDPEIASVAGPAFDANGFIGALSISGPLSRFGKVKIAGFRESVLSACKRLTQLGGGSASLFEVRSARR